MKINVFRRGDAEGRGGSPRLYRGYRGKDFYPEDINELLELRARQRTFDGAYVRGALADVGYALTILRLFDQRFSSIGVIYAVLAGLLYIISFFRHRHSRHDFADEYMDRKWEKALPTVGMQGKQDFGRPFVTAGWIVLAVTAVVTAVEVAILVIIWRMDFQELAAETGISANGTIL